MKSSTSSAATPPTICIIPSEMPDGSLASSTGSVHLVSISRKTSASDLAHTLSPRPRHKEYVFKGNEEKNMLKSIQKLSRNLTNYNKKYPRSHLSFSLSDISSLPSSGTSAQQPTAINSGNINQRRPIADNHRSKSDSTLDQTLGLNTLDFSSRSLSTWVAIGDHSVASELPSPYQHTPQTEHNLSPVDIVKSVSKASRISYLQKRIIQILSLNEKLRRVECPNLARIDHLGEWLFDVSYPTRNNNSRSNLSEDATSQSQPRSWKSSALTSKEIERDRGKPLSKYERNIMIFDWLFNVSDIA